MAAILDFKMADKFVAGKETISGNREKTITYISIILVGTPMFWGSSYSEMGDRS